MHAWWWRVPFNALKGSSIWHEFNALGIGGRQEGITD
jgi:hypothetical protein